MQQRSRLFMQMPEDPHIFMHETLRRTSIDSDHQVDRLLVSLAPDQAKGICQKALILASDLRKIEQALLEKVSKLIEFLSTDLKSLVYYHKQIENISAKICENVKNIKKEDFEFFQSFGSNLNNDSENMINDFWSKFSKFYGSLINKKLDTDNYSSTPSKNPIIIGKKNEEVFKFYPNDYRSPYSKYNDSYAEYLDYLRSSDEELYEYNPE